MIIHNMYDHMIYIYIYIYLCIYIYIYMHICIYIYIQMLSYIVFYVLGMLAEAARCERLRLSGGDGFLATARLDVVSSRGLLGESV